MPGVMITESLAQTCGLLIALSAQASGDKSHEGKVFFLAAANVKFKSVVKAGGVLSTNAKFVREYGGLYQLFGRGQKGQGYCRFRHYSIGFG